MQFETKKALLEYLGKNPDDRKLVDRMMLRGDVHKEDGMYVYIPQVKVRDLYDEIAQLKEHIHTLEGNVYTFNEAKDYSAAYKEAKAQRDYYQDLYENEVKSKQEIIRKCFRRIQQIKPRANWEEFRDWVLSDEEL